MCVFFIMIFLFIKAFPLMKMGDNVRNMLSFMANISKDSFEDQVSSTRRRMKFNINENSVDILESFIVQ